METLHFIRPMFLFAMLPGLLGLWFLYRRRGSSAGVWSELVDSHLQPYVLTSGQQTRQRVWIWWLAAAAIIMLCVSLAGPAWQRAEVAATRSGDAMVVLLDLSRSMDATDVAPSRLTRVRLKLQDILDARDGGETALVVFSANAFVVTPLTEDTDTIRLLVPTLTTDLMPSRGSYPESGIEKAMQLFAQSGVESGRILLIGDGGNMPPAMRAAREARAAGHQLSVLAVGTTEGGPIPQRRGGFVTDSRGNIAIPSLKVGELERLAQAGGGVFARLTSDDSDVRTLDVASRDSDRRLNAMQDQVVERWADVGIWLLLPVVLIASLMFRRGGFAVTLTLFVSFAAMPRAHAFSWTDLWQTKDQQAAKALSDGDSESAATLFEDPAWQAAATYQSGDFSGSAERYAALSDVESRYNNGNALARQGDFTKAIEAYQSVLEQVPDHEDARFNLELLQSLQDEQQSGQPDGDPSGDGEQGEQSEPQDGQPGDSQQQPGDASGDQSQAGQGQPGDSEESQQSASSGDEEQQRQDIEALQREFSEAQAEPGEAEQQQQALTPLEREQAEREQALEQWLRRVPDDPGGLLRRKFRSQYQRRQLDQDGNRLWPDDRSEPW